MGERGVWRVAVGVGVCLMLACGGWATPERAQRSPVSAPPPALEAPEVVYPDLTGTWVYRGLTPYDRPNLFSVQTERYRTLGGGRYAVERRTELSSADRGAFLGTWEGRGVLTLSGTSACFAWDQAELRLEPWVEEIKLAGDLRRRYGAEAVARAPCAELAELDDRRLGFKSGRYGWTVQREEP